MQIATNIEQSKRLLALGIDPNTADMYWNEFIPSEPFLVLGERPRNNETGELMSNSNVPAWSLSALLDLLPTPIFYQNRRQASMNIIRAHDGKSWHISYDFKPDAVSIGGKTLIDAAVRTLEYLHDRQNRMRIGINDPNDESAKAPVLFGMPYLYQSGDVDFHMKMVKLGLQRGEPLLCGGEHKCIMANKYEYWLSDYDNEEEFIKKYDLYATYTVEDFINKVKELKTEKV